MKDLEKTLNALLSEALEEDALENEPSVVDAQEAGNDNGYEPTGSVTADEVKPAVDSADAVVSAETDEKADEALPSADEAKEEINKALVGEPAADSVAESFDRINALLDQINEELDLPDPKIEDKDIEDAEELERKDVYPEDEDLEEKDIEEVDVDNEDIYSSDVEEKDTDVEGIVQENQLIFRILEDAGILAVEKSEDLAEVIDDDHYDEGNELVDDSELERKDVYPEDEDLEKKDIEEVDIDNEDIYNSETEVADEEVDSEVVNEALDILAGMDRDELCQFLEDNGFASSDSNVEYLTELLGFGSKYDAAIHRELDRKLDKGEIDANTYTKQASHTVGYRGRAAARTAQRQLAGDAIDAANARKGMAKARKEALKAEKQISDDSRDAIKKRGIAGAYEVNRVNKALGDDTVRSARDVDTGKYHLDHSGNNGTKPIDFRRKTTPDSTSNNNSNNNPDSANNNNRKKVKSSLAGALAQAEQKNISDADRERKSGTAGELSGENARSSKGFTMKKSEDEKYMLKIDNETGKVLEKKPLTNVSASYIFTDLDMMNILEANGFEPTIENFEILEEALELGYYSLVEEDDTIKIVPSDSEEEQYDVDEEISGECDEDDKGEVKPEDLHEEDEVKPEDLISDEKEETPEGGTIDQNLDVAGKSEENEEDPTTKLPMDNEPCDAEVKPEDIVVKESVRYTSIKEACMLDEGYFYEDSFLRESAAEKQERLVEQVALIMARESADPLYEELLKTAAYMARLQEGCKKKYGKKAMQEASKIMGEPNETLSENFI